MLVRKQRKQFNPQGGIYHEKKTIILICTFPFRFRSSHSGGVSVFADSDYSSQTITAKVTGIDGSSDDLQVGELNLPEKPDDTRQRRPRLRELSRQQRSDPAGKAG